MCHVTRLRVFCRAAVDRKLKDATFFFGAVAQQTHTQSTDRVGGIYSAGSCDSSPAI